MFLNLFSSFSLSLSRFSFFLSLSIFRISKLEGVERVWRREKGEKREREREKVKEKKEREREKWKRGRKMEEKMRKREREWEREGEIILSNNRIHLRTRRDFWNHVKSRIMYFLRRERRWEREGKKKREERRERGKGERRKEMLLKLADTTSFEPVIRMRLSLSLSFALKKVTKWEERVSKEERVCQKRREREKK